MDTEVKNAGRFVMVGVLEPGDLFIIPDSDDSEDVYMRTDAPGTELILTINITRGYCHTFPPGALVLPCEQEDTLMVRRK